MSIYRKLALHLGSLVVPPWALVALAALTMFSALWASPAYAGPYACNKCAGGGLFLPEVCWPAGSGEKGMTICVDGDATPCHLSGDSCTGTDGGGGTGGGGTGGGGTSTCEGGTFCPAECFSCSDPNAV